MAPTESLLSPPVFLGVLRVLARHESEAPSAPAIAAELATVQAETKTPVDLVRTPDRNLIRNSGQYWKGTGLLAPQDGEILLTAFGRRVAEGRITQGEFAATMVQQTILPNPWTYADSEIAKWKAANLEIRPLLLILSVMQELRLHHGGPRSAYLEVRELIKIVIPLAGAKVTQTEIASNVASFRGGKLSLVGWPDCAPQANDTRLAREFLLFLDNFGICRRVEAVTHDHERYYLDDIFDVDSLAGDAGGSIFSDEKNADAAVDSARHSSIPSIIERRRVTVNVLARPGQASFRAAILEAYKSSCFLTGESIQEILEAAHIVPVDSGGVDDKANGFCLRVDIHRLFDSGNIRFKPSGDLAFSDAVKGSATYGALPSKVTFPSFVSPANIDWRDKYY